MTRGHDWGVYAYGPCVQWSATGRGEGRSPHLHSAMIKDRCSDMKTVWKSRSALRSEWFHKSGCISGFDIESRGYKSLRSM